MSVLVNSGEFMDEQLSVDSRCPNCDNRFGVAADATEVACPFCADVVAWRHCQRVDQVFPVLKRWLTWTHAGCSLTHPMLDPASVVSAGSQQERYRSRIQPLLDPDEVVLSLSSGVVAGKRLVGRAGRKTTIAVTDRRVLIRTEKRAGYSVIEYRYDVIASVDVKKGEATANLSLSGGGAQTVVTVIAAEEIDDLVGAIRRRIAIG